MEPEHEAGDPAFALASHLALGRPVLVVRGSDSTVGQVALRAGAWIETTVGQGEEMSKPMPKPVKCACGQDASMVRVTPGMWRVWCEDFRCWTGARAKTRSAAIEEWNRVMWVRR